MSIVGSVFSSTTLIRINPRLASFMDSLLAIGLGLGVRFVVDLVSHHDQRLVGTLVGLWEGAVMLHFLQKMPWSFDPYVAYGVRLFVDFLATENLQRLVLVLMWTGMGMVLADVAPSVYRDVGLKRIWRRFVRDVNHISREMPRLRVLPKPRTTTVRFLPTGTGTSRTVTGDSVRTSPTPSLVSTAAPSVPPFPAGVTLSSSSTTSASQSTLAGNGLRLGRSGIPPRPAPRRKPTRTPIPGQFDPETDTSTVDNATTVDIGDIPTPGTSRADFSFSHFRDDLLSTTDSSDVSEDVPDPSSVDIPEIGEDEDELATQPGDILNERAPTPRQRPRSLFPPTPSDSGIVDTNPKTPITPMPNVNEMPNIPDFGEDEDGWQNIGPQDVPPPPPPKEDVEEPLSAAIHSRSSSKGKGKAVDLRPESRAQSVMSRVSKADTVNSRAESVKSKAESVNSKAESSKSKKTHKSVPSVAGTNVTRLDVPSSQAPAAAPTKGEVSPEPLPVPITPDQSAAAATAGQYISMLDPQRIATPAASAWGSRSEAGGPPTPTRSEAAPLVDLQTDPEHRAPTAAGSVIGDTKALTVAGSVAGHADGPGQTVEIPPQPTGNGHGQALLTPKSDSPRSPWGRPSSRGAATASRPASRAASRSASRPGSKLSAAVIAGDEVGAGAAEGEGKGTQETQEQPAPIGANGTEGAPAETKPASIAGSAASKAGSALGSGAGSRPVSRAASRPASNSRPGSRLAAIVPDGAVPEGAQGDGSAAADPPATEPSSAEQQQQENQAEQQPENQEQHPEPEPGQTTQEPAADPSANDPRTAPPSEHGDTAPSVDSEPDIGKQAPAYRLRKGLTRRREAAQVEAEIAGLEEGSPRKQELEKRVASLRRKAQRCFAGEEEPPNEDFVFDDIALTGNTPPKKAVEDVLERLLELASVSKTSLKITMAPGKKGAPVKTALLTDLKALEGLDVKEDPNNGKLLFVKIKDV